MKKVTCECSLEFKDRSAWQKHFLANRPMVFNPLRGEYDKKHIGWKVFSDGKRIVA